MTTKAAAVNGFGWGIAGGAALVALMYLSQGIFGLRPLPQLLNNPLLSLMPGPVFGFLIDTLQHAGKVLEELGLVVAMVAALGVLGAASAVASRRWMSQYLPFAFAGIGWVLVVAVLLPVSGAGFLGLNDGPATPIIWAALFAFYAVVLQYGGQPAPGFDRGRRRLLPANPAGVGLVCPRAGASWVGFKAVDGYSESLSLDTVNGAPEILVAYELDGAALPSSHGFPARVLIPGHYGMKGPKWLDTVELGTQETRGYWEQQGWDHNALVKTTSRIDSPHDGDIVHLGTIQVAGVAYAGTRGVSKVEYSTDGGSTWAAAAMDAPLSSLTWVLWRATWTARSEGAYRLVVRATDAAGNVQPAGSAASYPNGASGFHQVQVSVAK